LPDAALGQYQTRTTRYDVTADEDGRLWITVAEQNEALTVAERAGVPAEPDHYELRPDDGDVFGLTDPSGAAVRAVKFVGGDTTGRATFLHASRAAVRTD
jgi:hypothetical protein